MLAPLLSLPRPDLLVIGLLSLGWLVMFGPTYARLAETTWATDEQGHGPIILAVSFWMLYKQIGALKALNARPALVSGSLVLAFGLLLYAIGRSQVIGIMEVGAQIPVLIGLLLLFKGWRSLRVAWFSLFFLIFMCPLPSDLVAYVTGPLKAAVSAVAANLLHALGYPVGRAGVILTIGPYQLLVADACAGELDVHARGAGAAVPEPDEPHRVLAQRGAGGRDRADQLQRERDPGGHAGVDHLLFR